MENEDLEMMSNPITWPMYPLLPVKNHNRSGRYGSPDTGLLVAGKGANVYLADVFSGINAETEIVKYHSIDALVADGWIVD